MLIKELVNNHNKFFIKTYSYLFYFFWVFFGRGDFPLIHKIFSKYEVLLNYGLVITFFSPGTETFSFNQKKLHKRKVHEKDTHFTYI